MGDQTGGQRHRRRRWAQTARHVDSRSPAPGARVNSRALDALGLTVDDFEAIEAAAQEAARLTGEPPARIGLQMVLGAIERKRTRTDSNDKAANPQTSR
jgi:hypothetical protein